MGSSGLLDCAPRVAKDTARVEWHKYSEKLVPDTFTEWSHDESGFPRTRYSPFARSWTAWRNYRWESVVERTALSYERRGDRPALSAIEYGFCIGEIMGKYHGDKSAQDTNFVLVLNACDNSLWMVYNYYALNDDGSPALWKPVETSGLVELMNIPSDGHFDCLRILDHISKWNPDKPLAEIRIPVPPPTLRRLVATPTDKRLLRKYVAAQRSSSA